MRTQFLQVATIEDAYDAAPWAAKIVKVDGGFMAFESIDDFNAWDKQR